MRYSDTQRTLLKNSIRHNEIVSDVVALFTNPIRSEAAIIRQAQNLGYGIDSSTDGITRFTEDKGTRSRKKKSDTSVSTEAARTIVGESRTVPPVNEPTISETISTESDESISYPEAQINMGLKAYTDAVSILQNNNLPVDHNFVCIFSTYILSTKDSA